MSHTANHGHDLRRLLEALLSGDLGLDDALQKLRLLQVTQLGEFARLDVNRDLRKGVPEVIYAPRKPDGELELIVRRFLADRGLALVSRLDPERAEHLRLALAETEPVDGLEFEYRGDAKVLAAHTPAYQPPEPGGCVGLLTAGTSDIPVAEEAALVITHMGCLVERGYDTGVAGMHRLLEPLTRMIKSGADVLVVVAGMEGALPSVVAGLVDVPVIGVPTSTGYGLGGDGTAALYSILQSCSPGLVAVNIDNGVGAGAAAALIARRRRE
jgi:NCAIR mutase (PurE)-related protein